MLLPIPSSIGVRVDLAIPGIVGFADPERDATIVDVPARVIEIDASDTLRSLRGIGAIEIDQNDLLVALSGLEAIEVDGPPKVMSIDIRRTISVDEGSAIALGAPRNVVSLRSGRAIKVDRNDTSLGV